MVPFLFIHCRKDARARLKNRRPDPVAVGPPGTRRPPHRSLRAELPHKAPASGRNAQTRFMYRLTYPFQRTLQPSPALNPVASLLAQIAFGQPPFLLQLRRRTLPPNFVRRFLRYYGVVRLLRFVHRMLVPLGFHARTHRTPLRRAKPETSRLPCQKCRHMPWFFDRAGAMRASSWRRARCCLPLTIRKSAPRRITRFRGSIARPVGSSVNASNVPSRTHSHDSGSA